MIIRYLLPILMAIHPLVFCADHTSTLARHANEYHEAIAVIAPTKGNSVSGTFYFVQTPNGVLVNAVLSGLSPNQDHGVHVHEFGNVSDQESGKSAGGHYNPEKHRHGLPPNPNRHAGSFGNITANDNGDALFKMLDTTITIAGVRNPIIGRSVVVHANPDTGEQPAGNAGPRIGMGVIGIAKPKTLKR
jgi:Cu-Zn family superoxide dismutase